MLTSITTALAVFTGVLVVAGLGWTWAELGAIRIQHQREEQDFLDSVDALPRIPTAEN